jgi:hypothetical protein
MALHPLAGQPAPADLLIDVARLEAAYYANQPDLDNPTQRVAFGTSGHRGAPFDSSFTEAHIFAITQAICEYRRGQGIDGPLFMGADTHAASLPAQRTALEVLAANGVPTRHPARCHQRRLHADAGHLAGDPGLQPGAHGGPGRRHRHHALAQPPRGRRLQVQPARRRPRGHCRHLLGAEPRQRTAA